MYFVVVIATLNAVSCEESLEKRSSLVKDTLLLDDANWIDRRFLKGKKKKCKQSKKKKGSKKKSKKLIGGIFRSGGSDIRKLTGKGGKKKKL